MGCILSKHNRVAPEGLATGSPPAQRPRRNLITRMRRFFRRRPSASTDPLVDVLEVIETISSSHDNQPVQPTKPNVAFTYPEDADLTLPQTVALKSRVLRSTKPDVDSDSLRTCIEIQQESAEANRRILAATRAQQARDMRSHSKQ